MTKSRISLSGAVAIVICTAMILAGVHAAAQGVGGSVSGTVTAASGAVVKGATVTLTEMHKHQIVRTATTNSVGFYAAAALPPGTYSESVAADNFATSVLNGIVLHANDTLLVDQKLKAGDAKQSTTAISGKTRLNAVDAASTDLVNSVQVHGLPLANDNYTLLGKLTPGFVALGADSPYVGDAIPGAAGVLFGAAGHTTANVYWTLDGADNMDRATNQTTMNFPAAGAIQEVKVIRQNYSALLGRSIGAQAIVTTRSGSNELHGSLYEHFRNNAMNANYYYNNYAWPTVQTPESRYNEFGGTIGGPVVIENTYNGRDRTFFFVSTNILRMLRSTAGVECVSAPTEMKSTPACAKGRAVFRLIPPDASMVTFGARLRTSLTAFFTSRGVMLSSSRASAPPVKACSSSACVRTSTCTFCPALRPASAAASAFGSPPPSEMWLFLMRIPSCRSSRWFTPPPQVTAYLSNSRRPGNVLRVSSTWAFVPSISFTYS